MIKLLTVAATREVEKLADESGITYEMMMERAGRAVANRALAVLGGLPNPETARITVLIGPGNNGGDGLVAARILAQESTALVRMYLTKRRDAAADPVFAAAQATGAFMAFAEDDLRFRVLHQLIASATLVIDALYGIGTTPPLREEAGKLLRAAHKALAETPPLPTDGVILTPFPAGDAEHARPLRPYFIAVDCPSGLDCDSGSIDADALPADETVTFIAAKPGQFSFPGAAAVGTLHVATLGLPENLKPLKASKVFLADADYVRDQVPPRPSDGHKGTYGRALIVGGSVNYIGAPGLAAEAAYRSGAGLVTVAAPSALVDALAQRLIETTWLILPSDLGVLASGGAAIIRDEAAKSEALLIGPGMGREPVTRDLLRTLLTAPTASAQVRSIGFTPMPAGMPRATPEASAAQASQALPALVIDADALNLLSEIDHWWERLPANTILTPHPGEMARLCGSDTASIQANRSHLALEKAKTWKCVVMLKGAHTLVAAPDGRLAVLPFKTSALAKAGTGDVLAGVTVGLLAQGMAPFEAAVCAGFAHGLAGHRAAQTLGTTRAVLARDVCDALARVWADVKRE